MIATIIALAIATALLGGLLFLRRKKLSDLRTSEIRLRTLIELAPLAIRVSRDGKIIYSNQKHQILHGYQNVQEVTGREVITFWAKDFREDVKELLRRQASGDPMITDFEGMAQRKDGSQFPAHAAVALVALPNGDASLVFVTDLTERKRSERLLTEAKEQIQHILNHTKDAIFQIDLKGNQIYANAAADKLAGYPLQELLGTNMLKLVAPEYHDMVRERMQWSVAGEITEKPFQFELLCKNGHRIWIELVTSRVCDLEGRLVAIQGVARDVTERERAAKALEKDLAERKRMEESLKLFRALIDNAQDAIEVVDPTTGRFLDINQKASQIHGYTRDEYLASNVGAVDPNISDTGKHAWATRVRALQHFGFLNFESEHRRKDGSTFPVEISANYIRLERDYILAVVRDITERKRTEDQVRRLNRVYAVLSGINELIVRERMIVQERNPQALFEGACRIAVERGKLRMAWITLLDEATQTLKPAASAGVTDGFLELLNMDLKEAGSGLTARAIQSGKHQVSDNFQSDPALAALFKAFSERGCRSCAAFPLKISGKVVGAISFSASETNFFDAYELRLLDELATDIGFALEMQKQELDRQRAEQNLRTSERQFANAFEYANIGKALVAPDGRYIKANQTLCKMFGYTAEELSAKRLQDITHPEDLPKEMAYVRKLLAREIENFQMEKRYLHKEGWIVWVHLSRSLVRDDHGQPVHFISQLQDITERRKIEDQFRQAQKMEAIGQLAGGVAHDYNNILAAEMIQLGMLLEDRTLKPEMRETLELLKRGSERAANLTRQLLMFSRRQAMQVRRIELNALLENALKLLRRLLGENIELLILPQPGGAWIEADTGMIEQVIMNLCINARDAMPKGGCLSVGVRPLDLKAGAPFPNADAQPGKYFCLFVRDNGCGIRPEIMPKIFEPFFTTKEIGKGTGLGLATVYGIAKQHRGWVEVSSEAGQGSEFRVLLPASGQSQTADVNGHTGKLIRGTESVLFVEDDEALRTTIASCLEIAGYRVFTAPNGVEALRDWKERLESIDLLISDVIMPGGVNGLELAEAFKTVKPQIPVVLMSGYSKEILKSGIPVERGYVFLSKPCDPNMLTMVMRKALDQADTEYPANFII